MNCSTWWGHFPRWLDYDKIIGETLKDVTGISLV